MITHDIVFHGPRTFDVEIDGAIRHAFTYGARTQRFEVETVGLLSRDEIFGGELEPLFLRLKENKPDGMSIVYILNGGKGLNDELDDWMLSQMDDYALPQLNMSPVETAGIRLQTGGVEFDSTMAFGLKEHEIPLSSQMALSSKIAVVPALHSITMETMADIMSRAIVYLSDRDNIRLTTNVTQNILNTIILGGTDYLLLTDMDNERLSSLGEMSLNHMGSIGFNARLLSRAANMRNKVFAGGRNTAKLDTGANIAQTIYSNVSNRIRLTASKPEADLGVDVSGGRSRMVMATRLREEIKTGREIFPGRQISSLRMGRGTQPYLRYYDPRRISDMDMGSVFSLGEPNETIVLESIIQSGYSMSLGTTMALDEFVKLQNLLVKITPTQSGSGTPSPANIRPISAWTGANIYVVPSLESDDGKTYHVDWEDEAGVVCGGTLDVIGGSLVVDWVMLPVADLIVYNNSYSTYVSARIDPGYSISSVMSDRFSTQVASGTVGKIAIVSGRQIYFNIPIAEVTSYDTAGVKLWAETYQPQIVVKPSTAITHQLTPIEVRVLLGISTVSADCGEVEL